MSVVEISKVVEQSVERFASDSVVSAESLFIGRHEKVIEPLVKAMQTYGNDNGFQTFINHIMKTLLNGENKVSCIKMIRAITGVGLLEAKNFVEEITSIAKRERERDRMSRKRGSNTLGDLLKNHDKQGWM